MTSFVRRVVNANPYNMFLNIVCGLSAGAIGGAYVTPHNTVINTTISEVNGIAVRGEWIDLAFNLTRLQECDAKVERWLWSIDKNDIPVWVSLDASGSNPPTPIGVPTSYILSLPLPAKVVAGTWHYWSRTRDRCGWISFLRGENVRDSKQDVPITIIESATK